MPAVKRVSNEEVVAAYEKTGSVWKAAKLLGVGGQRVWELLKALNYDMPRRVWTNDELEELRALAMHLPIGKIALQLGRPYYGVAIKLSRLGIARLGHHYSRTKLRRGSGFNKVTTAQYKKQLEGFDGSLRSFSRMNGLDIELLVQNLQHYEPVFWQEYTKNASNLNEATCDYCGTKYYPMSAKQKSCTRKCSATKKRDQEYFGGKRRDTVGLDTGICQLCDQKKPHLSSHHVLGKENDPDNLCLVALCAGCHHLVGMLAGRKFTDETDGWENLIHLVMARRMAEKSKDHVGVYACVELEYLSAEELEEMNA